MAMAEHPSPGQLYNQAAGDTARYLQLVREHGYVLKPGDEGYEQGSRTLPCGWPGPQKPAAEWCIHDLPGEEVPDEAKPERGPWFSARFEGWCCECGQPVDPGDQIRADGMGGYLCHECGGAQ
jgi:hypothetical protein